MTGWQLEVHKQGIPHIDMHKLHNMVGHIMNNHPYISSSGITATYVGMVFE